VKNNSNDYVTRVLSSPLEADAAQWNGLLQLQPQAGPFMRHEYLAALHASGSAVAQTGWKPRFVTLWRGQTLCAACALYLKDHSYGEYVFDWAWANAYAEHGLDYYPKGLVAVPFTPVPGPRLLARDDHARDVLVRALLAWCQGEKLSSLHLLFGSPQDIAACERAGLMLRHTVQFHWRNRAPERATVAPPQHGGDAAAAWPVAAAGTGRGTGEGARYGSFDHFLASLAQEKRKKVRQERRKVAEAGVHFQALHGNEIAPGDWDFFYRCYERTYYEHGNAPYLRRDFFHRMARDMPENWLLFVAERAGKRIASSLIALGTGHSTGREPTGNGSSERVAFGRYWGALERVDCLHFEACYYQPLQWCIEHGYDRFEGGAQGEHKMARALMPVKTYSAHWLAHPAFADAVERFLAREGQGIENYLEHLDERSPFRRA
jgi:predicted N-acyltransferase